MEVDREYAYEQAEGAPQEDEEYSKFRYLTFCL
jgi:hypothetical protein